MNNKNNRKKPGLKNKKSIFYNINNLNVNINTIHKIIKKYKRFIPKDDFELIETLHEKSKDHCNKIRSSLFILSLKENNDINEYDLLKKFSKMIESKEI